MAKRNTVNKESLTSKKVLLTYKKKILPYNQDLLLYTKKDLLTNTKTHGNFPRQKSLKEFDTCIEFASPNDQERYDRT